VLRGVAPNGNSWSKRFGKVKRTRSIRLCRPKSRKKHHGNQRPANDPSAEVEVELRFELTDEDVQDFVRAVGAENLDPVVLSKWRDEGLILLQYSDSYSLNIPSALQNVTAPERTQLWSAMIEKFGEFDKLNESQIAEALPREHAWRKLREARTTAAADAARKPEIPELRRILHDIEQLQSRYKSKLGLALLREHLTSNGPRTIDLSHKGQQRKEDASRVVSETRKQAKIANVSELKNMRPLQRKRAADRVTDSISAPLSDILAETGIGFAVLMDPEELTVGVTQHDALLSIQQASGGTLALIDQLLPLMNLEAYSIILIDEPDIRLHVNAQMKLYERLCQIGQNHTIIISTHSPHMLPLDNLLNVKIIEAEQTGSVIRNSPHDTIRSETLSPIYEAIGFDVLKASPPIGERNVVVEGITDAVYLKAALPHLRTTLNASLIPMVGGGKATYMCSILEGWKLNYAVVVDNDQQGKATLKKFRDAGLGQRVVKCVDADGGAIEDLLSKSDLAKISAKEFPRVEGESNSAFIRRSKMDKKVLAQSFSNFASRGVPDDETLAAFEGLVERINKALEI